MTLNKISYKNQSIYLKNYEFKLNYLKKLLSF